MSVKQLLPPYKEASVAGVIGLLFLLAALAATLWTVVAHTPTPPDYALNSDVVYRVERELAVLAGLGLVLIFVAQFLAGRLPSSIGSGGLDWKTDAPSVNDSIRKANSRLDELARSVEVMTKSLEEAEDDIAFVIEMLEGSGQVPR